ncbi:MAG: sigma-54-dependent Fis family transcriptional regulator [Paludibacteraceae bacterium]|nr:sigma-54-dependent Fis family transcriptional regulator [Paludibacteraceae bacterium]
MTQQEIQNIKQRYSIIGSNEALSRAIEVAVQVARTRLSVMITGENGVGKDVFSRIIHDYSPRKHGPFFAINCGAIPEGTIDSELFGHVKGSFTDAKNDHKGYFEICDGGTLFLDEVGELPLSTQARLLRVLETGEFLKVGESKVQKTNVRVVAATNRDLPAAILDGRFRQDLYYRLNAIEIHIPSLRDRREDIPLLFRKFAMDFSEQNAMPAVRLTEDAKQLLKNYYWAGNIRQLKNVTEHVCLMEASREVDAATLRPYLPDNELNRTPAVTAVHAQQAGAMSDNEKDMLYRILDAMRKDIEDLHRQIQDIKYQADNNTYKLQAEPRETVNAEKDNLQPNDGMPIRHATNKDDFEAAEEYHDEEETSSWDEIEKRSIKQALERNNGSRKLAANELKISERTLYRKIKEYDL